MRAGAAASAAVQASCRREVRRAGLRASGAAAADAVRDKMERVEAGEACSACGRAQLRAASLQCPPARRFAAASAMVNKPQVRKRRNQRRNQASGLRRNHSNHTPPYTFPPPLPRCHHEPSFGEMSYRDRDDDRDRGRGGGDRDRGSDRGGSGGYRGGDRDGGDGPKRVSLLVRNLPHDARCVGMMNMLTSRFLVA